MLKHKCFDRGQNFTVVRVRETLLQASKHVISSCMINNIVIQLILGKKGLRPMGFVINSNSSSFTSNLCGFPNGVFIRIRLTRRGSSPLTKTFTSQQVFCGKLGVCGWSVEEKS